MNLIRSSRTGDTVALWCLLRPENKINCSLAEAVFFGTQVKNGTTQNFVGNLHIFHKGGLYYLHTSYQSHPIYGVVMTESEKEGFLAAVRAAPDLEAFFSGGME